MMSQMRHKERTAKSAERKKIKSKPTEFRYRPHNYDGEGGNPTLMRVWRTDWFGDQFEILSIANFNLLSAFCRQFGIPIEPYEED